MLSLSSSSLCAPSLHFCICFWNTPTVTLCIHLLLLEDLMWTLWNKISLKIHRCLSNRTLLSYYLFIWIHFWPLTLCTMLFPTLSELFITESANMSLNKDIKNIKMSWQRKETTPTGWVNTQVTLQPWKKMVAPNKSKTDDKSNTNNLTTKIQFECNEKIKKQ